MNGRYLQENNKDEGNEGVFKVSGTSFIEYNSKL
jgi:hypothetical protein